MHIKLSRVSKWFDDKHVLKGIDLQIEQGQFVALLGPSGCGKTTLLNALAGLVDIEDGVIQVDDEVWSAKGYNLTPERRNVGMVFQDFALWPHMTVFDNVAFGLKIKKYTSAQVRDRVAEVLDTVQMSAYANHYPHQLSGGQKQRIAIARALAPRPRVLLMDEPLSSLDAKLREQMRWDLLHIIQKADITTLYVTHDQVEALSMANHVVLLNQGEIEQEGTPKALYQRPATMFAATFMGASNLLKTKVVMKMKDRVQVDWNGCTMDLPSPEHVSESATVLIRPADVKVLDSDSMPMQDGAGISVSATIVQRAFQGTTWQYRVAVGEDTTLEVWHGEELEMGHPISLWIAAEHSQIVSERGAAVLTK